MRLLFDRDALRGLRRRRLLWLKRNADHRHLTQGVAQGRLGRLAGLLHPASIPHPPGLSAVPRRLRVRRPDAWAARSRELSAVLPEPGFRTAALALDAAFVVLVGRRALLSDLAGSPGLLRRETRSPHRGMAGHRGRI